MEILQKTLRQEISEVQFSYCISAPKSAHIVYKCAENGTSTIHLIAGVYQCGLSQQHKVILVLEKYNCSQSL